MHTHINTHTCDTYTCSWADSIVEDIFVGQLQSTITCEACGGASHCFDPFYSLALPLPAKGGPVTVQVRMGKPGKRPAGWARPLQSAQSTCRATSGSTNRGRGWALLWVTVGRQSL
mgnify:CR=1 FL=1